MVAETKTNWADIINKIAMRQADSYTDRQDCIQEAHIAIFKALSKKGGENYTKKKLCGIAWGAMKHFMRAKYNYEAKMQYFTRVCRDVCGYKINNN